MTRDVVLLPGIEALRRAVIHNSKLYKQQQKKESKHEPKDKR